MSADLLIGIESCAGSPLGHLVDLHTRLHVPGPYSLQTPAVHAFVAIRETLCWRLDEVMPRAIWTPCKLPIDGGRRVALWRVCGSREQIDAGIAKARALTGTPYDPVEIALQLTRWPMHEGMPGRRVCTSLTMDVLAAAWPEAETVLGVRDRLPETMLRAIEDNPGQLVREE
jgi:hypothetical protein